MTPAILAIASLLVVGAALAFVAFRLARSRDAALADRGTLVSQRDVALAQRQAAHELVARLERESAATVGDLASARERLDAAQDAQARLEEQLVAATRREAEFEQRFRTLAQETLAIASRQLRADSAAEIDERKKAVDALVKPIAETLKRTDEKLATLEKDRAASDATLREHLRALAESSGSLRDQTGKLVQALRRPEVRGRYGEIQLQRVVELAGLRAFCDFDVQPSSRDSEDRLLRPDMVVRLPNGRRVAVDAKTNIDAYISAVEAPDRAQQDQLLQKFADHVADQAERLSAKQYGANLDGALDFVVMFIPGDQFVDAALQRRPELLELAAQKGIVLASPSTLIGLLRAVHVGWREKNLGEQAAELFTLGRELHERASVALAHADKLGGALEAAVKSYNGFVASVDGRLMPTLRKFEDAGAKSAKELTEPAPIEVSPRQALPAVAPPPQ